MTDRDREQRQTRQGQPVDSEIGLRGILISTAGLVGITVSAVLLMWGFMASIFDSLADQDPPPPALAEAREPYLPPAPRLQTEPFTDLNELRAEEQWLLGSYGWINEPGSVARIPIERAMDLLVDRGSVEPFRVLQPGTETPTESSEESNL
jgi:hypothetical protein